MLIDTELQNTALSSAGSSSYDQNRSRPAVAQGGGDGGKNLTLPDTDQPEQPQQVKGVSLAESIEELLRQEPKEIYIDLDGHPSVTPQQREDKEYFGHIGLVLDNLLSSRLSKVNTIIHVDGPRSLENEAEHKRRDERLQNTLDKLTPTATKDKLESGSGLKAVYRICRSAYRLPPEALEQVLGVMEDSGWRVCRCEHQSDLCIATHVRRAPDKSDIRVVTHDSDLLAFEDIHSITIPASRDWTTYYKDELLVKLDLPSPTHLVFVSIITGNDYTRGVSYYGLASNTAIIRHFDLGGLGAMTGQDRVEGFQKLVGDYLDVTPLPESKAEIKDQKRIDRAGLQLAVTVADFQGAIGASVSCQESPQSTDGSLPPPAYDIVRSTLFQLEMRKARINSSRVKRIGVAAETRGASPVSESLMDAGEPSTPIVPAASAGQQGYFDSGRSGKAKTKRKRKHRGPRKNRANRRRLNKWRKSMFRRRTDLAHPYEPHEGFLPDASPVEEDALQHLTPSTPRPFKPKPDSSNNNNDGNSNNNDEGPKALKNSFGGAFKMMVLTVGSLWGCLRRATDLTSEEITQVVNKIDRAVFVMNSAKHLVMKMLEFFILRCLLPARIQEDRPQDGHEDDAMFGDDALDLLLGKDSAGVIIRNLISFALRGSTTAHSGRKAEKTESVRAYALAISIFEQFRALHPSIKALNPDHIPLSNIQQDLAPKICLAIKMHYRKLPTTIIDKMKKLGFEPSTTRSYDGENEEEGKEEENGDEFRDEEEETTKKADKIFFEAGHIKTWWNEMLRLPYDQRPRFCISTQLGDLFLDISEEALLAILWGESSGDVGRTMEAKVRSRTEAKVDQASNNGELMRRLFIGKPEDLVNKEVRQTNYGKKTTTMQELSTQHPQIYGQGSLARYTTQRINVLREIYNQNLTIPAQPIATTSPSSSTAAPQLPALPAPTGSMAITKRYALSNYLRTDGNELQLLAFDVRQGRESSFSKNKFIHRIETDFPTRHGTFCVRLGEDSAVNLLVKRSSLYQPTLAHRNWMQELKGAQPTADSGGSTRWRRVGSPGPIQPDQNDPTTKYVRYRTNAADDLIRDMGPDGQSPPKVPVCGTTTSRVLWIAYCQVRQIRAPQGQVVRDGSCCCWCHEVGGSGGIKDSRGQDPYRTVCMGKRMFPFWLQLDLAVYDIAATACPEGPRTRVFGCVSRRVPDFYDVPYLLSTRLAKPSIRVCACLKCQSSMCGPLDDQCPYYDLYNYNIDHVVELS
ncbi:MAG: hypothetical protein J3R72DRAFT_459524 [Linnemannia gamsii]|nr:MAG: hypothetical protein J3R72DRAFT_459524 [Linnemannia gamsii]